MKEQDMEVIVWTVRETGMDRTVSAVVRITISERTSTVYHATAVKSVSSLCYSFIHSFIHIP
jgi:hypothetical protein